MASKNLTIKDWQLGIGQSPYLGFAQMRSADVFTKPGCLMMSKRLQREDIDPVPMLDLLIRHAVDPRTGDFYFADRSGNLYKRDSNGIWTGLSGYPAGGNAGQGLAVWKDYLIYARSNALDAYGPLSGAATWTNNWWTSLESSLEHPMIVLQDDRLYIGNTNFMDVCGEVFGQVFDPANPATYAYSGQALPLKQGYSVHCLEELGANLVIGTTFGIQGDQNVADMFFWNGNDEFVSAGQTIRFVDNGVQMTKNVGNMLFTIAGLGAPRIFKSLTSQGVEYLRINSLSGGDGQVALFPEAIEQKDGEVLFGIGQSTSFDGTNPMGVYSVRNGAYVLRYPISTGDLGNQTPLLIGLVTMLNSEDLLVSWYNGTEYGVDVVSRTLFRGAYVETPVYTVGTESDPVTFERVEFRLGTQLNAGDVITLRGRKSLTEPFVTLATLDSTHTGRNVVELKAANMRQIVELQCSVEIAADPSATSSPELKEIVFY